MSVKIKDRKTEVEYLRMACNYNTNIRNVKRNIIKLSFCGFPYHNLMEYYVFQ